MSAAPVILSVVIPMYNEAGSATASDVTVADPAADSLTGAVGAGVHFGPPTVLDVAPCRAR